MERSVIRERPCQVERPAPDYAALHPGYEPSRHRSGVIARLDRVI
jgi:hypothetical protein